MSAPPKCSVPLYTAQIHVATLTKWAQRMPREIGGAIIAESVTALCEGDAGPLKSLPFVSRLNRRRRHTRRTLPD